MSAYQSVIEAMKNLPQIVASTPTLQAQAWDDFGRAISGASPLSNTYSWAGGLIPYTFLPPGGTSIANPIPGEIQYALVDASYDPNTGLTTPAGYQMSFWDGTQWVSTGTGGGGGTTGDTTILLSGGTPTFSNSYSITRNADNTPLEETWTDTSTSRLRRRMGYSYASGRVSSIRTRVYSSVNGTTVTGDMTETFTYNYSTGLVSSSITVRTV